MNLKLGKVTIADAARLLEMQRICFTPHLERYQDFSTSPATVSLNKIENQIINSDFLKIIKDDIWVGSINIKKQSEEGEVFKLCTLNVLPEYQNQGIGQRSLYLIEELFPRVKVWLLDTLKDMPRNRYMYEKMGYKITGKSKKINDKLTLISYKKKLI